jgi:hypothetical protein
MNWTWVVAIEGVGLGNGAFPTGFSTIEDPGDGVRPSNNQVVGTYAPLLVPGSISLGEQSINPLSADPPAQSLSFSLILTDALFDVFFKRPEPIGRITTTITPSSTSFSGTALTGTLETAIGSANYVYIGREAFSGSATGNTFSILDAVIDGPLAPIPAVSTTPRGAEGDLGHLFTRVTTHTTSTFLTPPLPDDRIYLQPPTMRGRRVFLYRGGYNAAGEYLEQLFGQYIISDDISTNDAGTVLNIKAKSLISTANAAKFNTNPQTYVLEFYLAGGDLLDISNQTQPSDNSLYARSQTDYIAVPVATRDRAFLVSGTVNPLPGGGGVLGFRPSSTIGLGAFDIQRQFGYESGTPDKPGVINVAELLVSDPAYTLRTTEHPFYDGTAIVQNPVIMALQHLGEHPSNLSRNWTLLLGPGAVDVDGITQLAETYQIVQWPGVVAGGDGKSVAALKWIAETYLRPIGIGWAVDQYGRLTMRSLLSPEVSGTAITNANTLTGRMQSKALSIAADAVRINAGQGGGDVPRLIITGSDAYLPDPADPQSSIYEIDGAGYINPNSDTGGIDLLSDPGVSFARSYVGTLSRFLSSGPLYGSFTITTAGLNTMSLTLLQDVLPGDIVDITLTGLRGFDGALIQGIVTKQKFARDFATQDVSVLMLDVSTRRWSAAAEIATVTDNGDGTFTLTFTADDTIQPQPYSVQDTTYTTDLQTLVDQYDLGGVTLNLCDDALAVRDSVTFDGVDTVTSATTPAAGDWLVLGDLGDNSASDAEALFGFIDRDDFSL